MASRGPSLLLTLLLAAPLLAGCLSSGSLDVPGDPLAGLAAVSLGDRTAYGTFPLLWEGTKLVGEERGWQATSDAPSEADCLLFRCAEDDPPCEPANCERTPFELRLPPAKEGVERTLEVSIRWPTDYASWLLLHLEDEAGTIVATGGHSGYAYSVGRVALVEDPKPGNYTVVVRAAFGAAPYEAVIQLEERPVETGRRELLPNLVTMAPTDLRIETPTFGGVGAFIVAGDARPVADLTGSRGCGLEEVADHQHQRCLRFSNSVGNVGEGPLEIRLPVAQGALAAAAGAFVQRIFSTDGSHRDLEAGAAEFHAYHGHWHNAAANRYWVVEYDLNTGARGAEVGEGRKAGVCLANVGLVDLGLPHTAVPRWNGTECFAPLAGDEPPTLPNGETFEAGDWAMGLAPNWYDEYPWLLTDQYVEITGVPDGVYQLCSVVNQDATLLETTPQDNEACATFRLKGDEVTVLSDEPYNKEPPGVQW